MPSVNKVRLDQVLDINLEEYSSKTLSLPAAQSRYIEITASDELWDARNENIEHKLLPFARSELLEVPIKSSRIACQGEDIKKIVEIIFDLKDHKLDFLPGDTIGIQPTNRDKDVFFLLEALELLPHADKKINLSIMKTTQKKNAKLPAYLPQTSTFRNILKHYLNIYSIPKKLFIRSLVEFTQNENDRLLLKILCSKEGSELYNQCIVQNGVTFLNLLKLCPSCTPPLEIIIENLPRLLPRPYSIANSPLKSPSELKILFSILADESQKGLTTEMLEILVESFPSDKDNAPTARLYLRDENSFKYTEKDLDKNIIMVGVGCGISPFIGFMEHKAELCKHLEPPIENRETWLFSGSRYRCNAVYRAEIREFLQSGVISEHFESYSREIDSNCKYVQDHILANAERFVELLLSAETKVYVCADGNDISKKIAACVLDCLQVVCNLSADEANVILTDMRKKSRYIEDIWL